MLDAIGSDEKSVTAAVGGRARHCSRIPMPVPACLGSGSSFISLSQPCCEANAKLCNKARQANPNPARSLAWGACLCEKGSAVLVWVAGLTAPGYCNG